MSQELEPSRNKGTVYMGKMQNHLPGQGGVLPHLKASGRGALGKSSLGVEHSFCCKKAKAMFTEVAAWIGNFTHDRHTEGSGQWEVREAEGDMESVELTVQELRGAWAFYRT